MPHDVVVIGGGNAGMAIAGACKDGQLSVIVVETCCISPDWYTGEWVQGRGAVAGKGLAVVLDPETSDERRLLPCTAIVIATGAFDPSKPSTRQLGITKLGAEFSEDGTSINTDSRGRTRAPGIFAVGSAASTATPDVMQELALWCNSAKADSEESHP